MNPEGPVAVIDIGSNTIKLAVLSGTSSLYMEYYDVRYERISRGARAEDGQLESSAIEAAAESVKDLKRQADKYNPSRILLVATSAIRNAQNRDACLKRIEDACGLPVQVLSGLEEAELIGRGVVTDPVLSDLNSNFCLVDIGGGSLECAHFQNDELHQVVSLPLGAVTMSERFIRNPEEIISFDDSEAIFEFVLDELRNSSFDFSRLPLPLVGTGGAFVAVRSILAERDGTDLKESQPFLNCEDIGEILMLLCKKTAEQREEISGMPRQRADILPAGLVIVLALAELAGTDSFIHSFHNLPYGVAARALEDE